MLGCSLIMGERRLKVSLLVRRSALLLLLQRLPLIFRQLGRGRRCSCGRCGLGFLLGRLVGMAVIAVCVAVTVISSRMRVTVVPSSSGGILLVSLETRV